MRHNLDSRRFTRSGKVVLPLLLMILFSLPLAFSQDAEMLLSIENGGSQERPPVLFSHEKHATDFECVRCHHDYDKYLNNAGGDGQPCADCHQREPQDRIVSLVDAYHIQCKSCHEESRDRLDVDAPVMCGQCHVRK